MFGDLFDPQPMMNHDELLLDQLLTPVFALHA